MSKTVWHRVAVVAALAMTAGSGSTEAAMLSVGKPHAANQSAHAVRYYGSYYRGGGVRYYRPAPRAYFYVGPPVAAYGYSYYGGYYSDGGHCAWLYRNARSTGSAYWWRRYHNEC